MFKDPLLSIIVSNFMMKKWTLCSFLYSWCTRYYYKWRFFSKGLGSSINNLQSAYTIGYTYNTQSINASICISCKSRSLLITGINDLKFIILAYLLVKSKCKIARHTKDMM